MPALGSLPVENAADVAKISRMRVDRCPCGQRRPMGVLLGMRSGARPRLEGHWYCRKACLLAALQERVRRDFPKEAPQESKLRHRVPLGLLLQARGVIRADQLKQALEQQEATGRRLGQVLTEKFGVREERITAAIAAQWGLPVMHLPEVASSRLCHLAPAQFFARTGCLPVERRQGRLLLACAEGADPGMALALERMHGLHVDFGVVASTAFDQWREFPQQGQIPLQMELCADRRSMAAHATALLLKLQPVESRVVRMGRWWWMRVWLEQHALHHGEAHADTLDVVYAAGDEGSHERASSRAALALS